MRVIEKEMLNAIADQRDWQKNNTAVRYRLYANMFSQGWCDVYLHGHHIATVYDDGTVEADAKTLACWPTNTTKSRLRALGVDVYTKNHITYLDGVPV